MTKPTAHQRSRALPVIAFDPKLLAILLKATRERVEITTGTPNEIRTLQRTFWSLVAAMKREAHVQYAQVSSVKCALRTSTGEVWLVGSKNEDLRGRKLHLVLEAREASLSELLDSVPLDTSMPVPVAQAESSRRSPAPRSTSAELLPSDDDDLMAMLLGAAKPVIET